PDVGAAHVLQFEQLIGGARRGRLLQLGAVRRARARYVEELAAVASGERFGGVRIGEQPLLVRTGAAGELDDGCAVRRPSAAHVYAQAVAHVAQVVVAVPLRIQLELLARGAAHAGGDVELRAGRGAAVR